MGLGKGLCGLPDLPHTPRPRSGSIYQQVQPGLREIKTRVKKGKEGITCVSEWNNARTVINFMPTVVLPPKTHMQVVGSRVLLLQ